MPALLWGVAFANIVRGVPIDADSEYVGGFFNLLNPYALLGGLTTLLLFLTHGAVFISLKTDGRIRHAARGAGRPGSGVAAAAVAVAFLVWTQVDTGTVGSAVLFVAGRRSRSSPAWSRSRGGREGWAFVGTFVAIAPGGGRAVRRAVPRRDADLAWPTASSLTTTNAAATAYTLKIMTVVAVVFTPLVLLYQGWTYWVFRQRIAVHHIPATAAGAASAAAGR